MIEGEERRIDNYIIRKRVQTIKKQVTRDENGKYHTKKNVEIRYISLRPASNAFRIEWREDSPMYLLVDHFVEDAVSGDKTAKTMLNIIFGNITAVCGSVDLSHEHTVKDADGEEKEVVDGLHLSVLNAISEYIKRVESYTYETSDSDNEKMEKEDKLYYSSIDTLNKE